MPVHGLQLVVSQPGEEHPAHLQRAIIRIRQSRAQKPELVPQETNIERRVMRNEDAIIDEGSKAGKRLVRFRLAEEHLVGDAVHLFGRKRNVLPWIN